MCRAIMSSSQIASSITRCMDHLANSRTSSTITWAKSMYRSIGFRCYISTSTCRRTVRASIDISLRWTPCASISRKTHNPTLFTIPAIIFGYPVIFYKCSRILCQFPSTTDRLYNLLFLYHYIQHKQDNCIYLHCNIPLCNTYSHYIPQK